jgi:hypothetical protein
MRSFAAVILFVAGSALAQSTDIGSSTPRQDRSRAGTVTNPPISGSAIDPDGASAAPDAPPSRAVQPEIHQPDISVRQQAEAKRRQALEHCQTLTGASRTDCAKRAGEEYKRGTGNDTLSYRGSDPFYG